MVKFLSNQPHQYYLDVLEHFNVQVHEYCYKYYGIVKEDPDRYHLFIAKITFEDQTGYITGPYGPSSGDGFCFPYVFFNGEMHINAKEGDDISDLDDYPTEYDENIDVKPSILKKSFNFLLYDKGNLKIYNKEEMIKELNRQYQEGNKKLVCKSYNTDDNIILNSYGFFSILDDSYFI